MLSMPDMGLSSPSFFPRNKIPISQENTKPGVELPTNYWSKETFNNPLHDQISNVDSEDSVTRKRRHAVYVPRPPIWRPSPVFHEGQFPVFGDEQISGPFSEIDIDRHMEPNFSGSHHVNPLPHSFEQDTPDISSGQIPEDQVNFEQELLRDVAAAVTDAQVAQSDWAAHNAMCSPYLSEDSSTQSLLPEPYLQEKAGLCTRLQSYRDIRLGVGEKWAIQEGSLVMCIDPPFTSFHPERQCLRDEFDLVPGDLYVVCKLYADLWALCIKMSFDPQAEGEGEQSLDECTVVGFIPLCAVTLAVNYSSFLRRCAKDESPRYTGNGLPTVPPSRSHSLNAGKQLFEGSGLDVDVPEVIHAACHALSVEGINADFVPLDSNLAPLFSGFGGRRDRVRQMGKRILSRKPWHSKPQAAQPPVMSFENRERRSFSLRDLSWGSQHSRIGNREARATSSIT